MQNVLDYPYTYFPLIIKDSRAFTVIRGRADILDQDVVIYARTKTKHKRGLRTA